jgi:DNA-binding MarR family transcriptional regulator
MDDSNKELEVVKLFFEMHKSLRNLMKKSFEDFGITMPQSIVVGTLVKNGEMKITDLSSMINLSNSTISGIVDRLEKQQLVVRRRSEEDRRTVYVKATPRFEEMHREFHTKLEERFKDLLREGTHEELDKIMDGLNILKKILNDRKE